MGTSRNDWYKGAVEYWDKQSNTDDGVLGGLSSLSGKDVRDSLVFVKKVSLNWRFTSRLAQLPAPIFLGHGEEFAFIRACPRIFRH